MDATERHNEQVRTQNEATDYNLKDRIYQAIRLWQRVIDLGPNTEMGKEAKKNMDRALAYLDGLSLAKEKAEAREMDINDGRLTNEDLIDLRDTENEQISMYKRASKLYEQNDLTGALAAFKKIVEKDNASSTGIEAAGMVYRIENELGTGYTQWVDP